MHSGIASHHRLSAPDPPLPSSIRSVVVATNHRTHAPSALTVWLGYPDCAEALQALVDPTENSIAQAEWAAGALDRLEAIASIQIAGGGADRREAWRTAMGLLPMRLREDAAMGSR